MPPGNIWQCLETFLGVTTAERLLASNGRRPGTLLTSYGAQDRPPRQGIIRPDKSTVLRVRNPDLEGRWSLFMAVFLYAEKKWD